MKDDAKKFNVNLEEAIPSDKEYKITETGKDGRSLVVTVPRGVIKREANTRDISVEDFINKFRAVWYADSFKGLHLGFVESEDK